MIKTTGKNKKSDQRFSLNDDDSENGGDSHPVQHDVVPPTEQGTSSRFSDSNPFASLADDDFEKEYRKRFSKSQSHQMRDSRNRKFDDKSEDGRIDVNDRSFPPLSKSHDMEVVCNKDVAANLPKQVPEDLEGRCIFLRKCTTQYITSSSGIRWHQTGANLNSILDDDSDDEYKTLRRFNINTVVNFSQIFQNSKVITVLDMDGNSCKVQIPKRIWTKLSQQVYAHLESRIPDKLKQLYLNVQNFDGVQLVHNIRTTNLSSIHKEYIDVLQAKQDAIQLTTLGEWPLVRAKLLQLHTEFEQAVETGTIEERDAPSTSRYKKFICDTCEDVLDGLTSWYSDGNSGCDVEDLLKRGDILATIASKKLERKAGRGESGVTSMYSNPHAPSLRYSRSKGKGKGKSKGKGKHSRRASSSGKGKGKSSSRPSSSSRFHPYSTSRSKGTGKGGRWNWQSDWFSDSDEWKRMKDNKWVRSNRTWYHTTSTDTPTNTSASASSMLLHRSTATSDTSSTTTPSSPQVVRTITRTIVQNADEDDCEEEVPDTDDEDDMDEGDDDMEDVEYREEGDHEDENERNW